jgi:S-adenosylmethionine hydrolase
MTAITLLTDFGLRDGHVGAMKGVIHGIAPDAALVDISHSIPPQDIRHAGFVLATAYAYWPPGTIHVIVVDPGVGTGRRAVAVRTIRGTFVAPDNGVLSYVLAREQVTKAVALANPAYWHHPVSAVFHGRDIFGPAAAHLARGVPLEALGEAIEPPGLVRFPVPVPSYHNDGRITAHVQHIDGFGNCTTDLPGDALDASARWRIQAGRRTIEGLHHTFGDVPEGEPVALVDSTGFVAIAVRNGNAAEVLGLAIDQPVVLHPAPAERGSGLDPRRAC